MRAVVVGSGRISREMFASVLGSYLLLFDAVFLMEVDLCHRKYFVDNWLNILVCAIFRAVDYTHSELVVRWEASFCDRSSCSEEG